MGTVLYKVKNRLLVMDLNSKTPVRYSRMMMDLPITKNSRTADSYQHSDLLEKIKVLAKKKKIKLILLGHSLGAGAASSTCTVKTIYYPYNSIFTVIFSFHKIAGIELNNNPFTDVEVVGFGCSALLPSELPES